MKKLSQHAFLKRIKDTIKHYEMLENGDRVLVAVSGGPDSVCLLKVLSDLRKDLGIGLVVANLDHGIRGKESRSDSDFVRKLAKDLVLDYAHERTSIGKEKGAKLSVEERAREFRYGFFKRAAAKYCCNVLATGHTMDDQAETVLMRVITGSSLRGLAGIPPVRQEAGLRIIRPLIRVEKKEVVDHLLSAGIRFKQDRTNIDRKYMRNSVRLDILPFLEKYNPRVKRALTNLGDVVREDVLTGQQYSFPDLAPGTSPSVRIKDLVLQPKTVRKSVFKELFIKAGGDVKKLTYRHWMDVDLLLRTAEKGKALDLPGNVRAVKTKDSIKFEKKIY